MLRLCSLYVFLLLSLFSSTILAQTELIAEWQFKASGSFNYPVYNGLSKADSKFIGVVSSETGMDSVINVLLSDDGGLNWRVALKDRNLNLDANMMPGEGDWISRWYHSIARPTKDLVIVLASDRPKDDPDPSIFGTLAPYLLRSEDAGHTWTRIPIVENAKPWSVNYMSMADPNTGYLVSNSLPSKPGHETTIYKSVDAGKTWQPLSMSFAIASIRFFQALSASQLIITTDQSTHITTDGGASWTHNEPAPKASAYSFNSVDRGYAIGGAMTGNGQQSTVEAYRTTNGGKSWLPLLDTLLSGSNGDEIAFYDDQHGALISRGVILQTSDGGATWYQVPGPYELVEETGQDIFFTSNTTAVALFQNQVAVLTGEMILRAPSPQLIQTSPLSYLLEWTPIDGATSYQVQLAEKPAAGLIAYDLGIFETSKKILDTSVTSPILGLPLFKYNRDYYVRVKAIGDDRSSGWSAQIIRRTPEKPAGTGLTSPMLLSPSHDTMISSPSVVLRWKGDDKAIHYSVKLTTYGTAAASWHDSVAENAYGVTSDSLVVQLEQNKTYNWFIIAHGSEGDSIASTTLRSFHTSTLLVEEATTISGRSFNISSSIISDYIVFTGEIERLSLFNSSGSVVRSMDFQSHSGRMYVGDLAQGLYFLVGAFGQQRPVHVQVLR